MSLVYATIPWIISGGIRNPSATPSWFPKTPSDVAVEISFDGNQIDAIFGGSSRMKH